MTKKSEDKQQKATRGSKKKQADVDKLEQELTDLKESLLRERADSENMRRRHEGQVADLKTYVTADVIRSLLPVIDNIERAQQHVPDDIKDSQYVKGVESVSKQFRSILEKLGVERIATVGESFNPELHEAVSMDDSEGGDAETVTGELQTGYKLGDHVIRHAMVNVKTSKK